MGGENEFEALRAIEELMRGFSEYVDHHTRAAERRGATLHPFSPRTVEMVEQARPLLRQLDEARASRPRALAG